MAPPCASSWPTPPRRCWRRGGSPDEATRTVQVVVEQLDPPRWPRLGAAWPVEYEISGTSLHGPKGLGGADVPCAQLHHPAAADKLLSELVRAHPREVAVLVL